MEKIIIAVLIIAPLLYFWVFWLNPFTIKQILMKKGYCVEYVKTFLKEKYTEGFYDWIPKMLLK